MSRSASLRTLLVPALALVPVLAGSTGCASFPSLPSFFGGKKGGLHEVDDLVGRIRDVQEEVQGSKADGKAAMDALFALLGSESGGAAATAHTELLEAIIELEERSEDLHAAVESMKNDGDVFFDQWTANFEGFTSAEMRRRSQERFQETVALYDAILVPLDPARVELDRLIVELRDLALYLGNDFNTAAVAGIEGEIRAVTNRAAQLGKQLDLCHQRATEYVSSVTLPGRDDWTQPPASAPATTADGADDSQAP